MTVAPVTLAAVPGIPNIGLQDDLTGILAAAMTRARMAPAARDILVVAQKIVSKEAQIN